MTDAKEANPSANPDTAGGNNLLTTRRSLKTDVIKTDDHTTGRKVTAEEVENNCPAELQDLGKRIAVDLDKARKCAEKFEQYYTSIDQYLAEAQRICDDGGFKAFREKFFPDLGKSRVYELLQIATNKKSNEQVKASTRERVAKYRAKKATGSVTVTEKPGSAGDAEDFTIPTEATRDPVKPRSTVSPKDEALLDFSARVRELIRIITKQKPDRFALTSVSPEDLARLGKFLSDLADLKRLRSETDAANDMAA